MEQYGGIRCWSCQSIIDKPTTMQPYQESNPKSNAAKDYGALRCTHSTCGKRGFVCLRDSCIDEKLGSRKHLKNIAAVTNHRRQHTVNKMKNILATEKNKEETEVNEEEYCMDIVPNIPMEEHEVNEVGTATTTKIGEDTTLLNNSISYSVIHANDLANLFYQHTSNTNGIAGGVTYLVCKALHRQDVQPVCNMHVSEVDIHLHTAQLMMGLSRTKRESLAQLLKKITEETMRRSANETRAANTYEEIHEINTPLPTSYSKFARTAYFDGKHAIVRNLPTPIIEGLSGDDGRITHTYLSLCEMLRCYYANGDKAHNLMTGWSDKVIYPVKTASESLHAKKQCQSIMSMNDISTNAEIIPLWEWSDDCEPNAVKQNKQSIWAKVVSVMPHSNQQSKILCHNSFVISLGAKGGDHDLVEKRLHEELNVLRSTGILVWDRETCHEKTIYATMLTSLKDQPERRSSNRLGQGNSKYHARWGWSFDLKSNWRMLSACNTCYERDLKVLRVEGQRQVCKSCTCWDMESPSSAERFETEVTAINLSLFSIHLVKKYFHTYSAARGKKKVWYHRPFQVDYDCLVLLTKELFNLVIKGKVSVKEAKAFLSMLTINEELANEICDNAKSYIMYESSKTEGNIAKYNRLKEIKDTYPSKFECPIPALWNRDCVPLAVQIDVPMHLLFLGIVRSVAHMNQAYMVSCRRGESFLRSVKGWLEQIQALQLNWCRAAPYKGGKFGGWVSENYLCLARVATWFYSDVEAEAEDNACDYKDPDADICPSLYTVSQCKLWLKARAIRFKHNLTRQPLRDLVQKCIENNGGKPPLLDKKLKPNVVLLNNVVMAMTCLISECMQSTVTEDTIQRVDKFVKLFLSTFHRLDEHVNPKNYSADPRAKPSWVSSYNFICLLNLPQVIKQHGPLRGNWEGHDKGEAALRVVKPELKHGLKGAWMLSAHKNLANKTMLNLLSREINLARKNSLQEELHLSRSGLVELDGPTENSRELRNYYRYSCTEDVELLFEHGKPVSFVCFGKDCNSFGIAIKKGRKQHNFIELIVNKTNQITSFGINKFHLLPNGSTKINADNSAKAIYYCLGLPCGNSLYTIITSEWDVGDYNNGKVAFEPPFKSIYEFWNSQKYSDSGINSSDSIENIDDSEDDNNDDSNGCDNDTEVGYSTSDDDTSAGHNYYGEESDNSCVDSSEEDTSIGHGE